MFEVLNLSKSYNGTVALDQLNITIQADEIFCLLGANGAGKTTTISLFLNFIPPSSGTAKIDELDVVQHPLETITAASVVVSPTPVAQWSRTPKTARSSSSSFAIVTLARSSTREPFQVRA